MTGWGTAPEARCLARFDLAGPVLIALVAFISARRRLAGRTTYAPGIPAILGIYAGWLLTIAFAITALHVHPSRGRLLATAVFFRGSGTPLLGLGVGPFVLTVVLTMVLTPLIVGLIRLPGHPRRVWTVPIGLGVVALTYRLVCTATGHTGLFGPLSWFPNHLDVVAVGLGMALIDNSLKDPHARRRLRIGGIVAAVVSFLIAAFALGLPRSPRLDSAVHVHTFALASVVVAAGVIAAACVVPPSFTLRRAPRLAGVLAIAAPGVLLAGEPAFTLVARQYHERVFEIDGAAFLHGNVVAPFVWSLLITGAFGVVVAAAVGVAGLVKDGEWRLIGRSRLALPTVVATGFFVRVITLLTVAPERTDGGDPLFYHTTANVLAHGRGFPEPLNWIAYGIHRPSAFHGPLYPIVLSISSRFGGTSYFDHKMMSIVVGTGLVLAVGVLAKRLGGTAVGLVAAAFAAFYPNLWLIDSLLYPEGLMALLATITMIVAYRWRDRPRLATAALFGAVIALTALARGEGILLVPLLALPWMMFTRSLAPRVRFRHLLVTVRGMQCRSGTVDDPQRDHLREVRSVVDERQRGDGLRQLRHCLQRPVRGLLGLPVPAIRP